MHFKAKKLQWKIHNEHLQLTTFLSMDAHVASKGVRPNAITLLVQRKHQHCNLLIVVHCMYDVSANPLFTYLH